MGGHPIKAYALVLLEHVHTEPEGARDANRCARMKLARVEALSGGRRNSGRPSSSSVIGSPEVVVGQQTAGIGLAIQYGSE
jgi:hypothetical protein